MRGGGQESALCAGWGLSVPGAWGGLEGPEQGLRALVGPLRTRSVRHYLSTEGAALRSAKAFLVWQASSMRRRRTVLKAARQRWCRGPAGVPEATHDVRKDLEEVWGLEAACQRGRGAWAARASPRGAALQGPSWGHGSVGALGQRDGVTSVSWRVKARALQQCVPGATVTADRCTRSCYPLSS